MSYAPQSITDLAKLWTNNGGVNLGIVGDTRHTAGGVSYHIGKDHLISGAYSARTARDRAGLTNAASALDLGKLHGSFTGLRNFSKWLVEQARANKPGTSDIREIIFSPDGKTVYGWSRENGVNSALIKGYGDNTHLTHTHISFYRDSEKRSKTGLFAPYFHPAPPAPAPVPAPQGETMGLSVELAGTKDATPLDAFGTSKIKGNGHAVIRVSDKHGVAVPDGKDLGVVQKGVLKTPLDANPGDRKNVVVFNMDGEQHVALLSDVDGVKPLEVAATPAPVDTRLETAKQKAREIVAL